MLPVVNYTAGTPTNDLFFFFCDRSSGSLFNGCWQVSFGEQPPHLALRTDRLLRGVHRVTRVVAEVTDITRKTPKSGDNSSLRLARHVLLDNFDTLFMVSQNNHRPQTPPRHCCQIF